MDAIRRMFFQNVSLKAASLAIAIGLYVYANLSQNAQLQITVPVELRNVPESMIVSSAKLPQIRLLVRGPRSALTVLPEQPVSYPIDVSATGVGKHQIQIDISKIELPRGVDILQINPVQFDMTIAPTQQYERPIKPQIKGNPGDGFRVSAVEVQPEKMVIVTAKGALDDRPAINSKPIDIEGRTEDVVVQAELDVEGIVSKQPPVNLAQVAVRIQPIIRQAQFKDIPVIIQGMQSSKWRVVPRTVTIEVVGADAPLKALEKSGIKAEIQITAIPNSRQRFPVSLRLPPEVTLLSVTPAAVKVNHAN